MTVRTGTMYVIRKKDGSYFMGLGYAGPGKVCPYFTDDLSEAKTYKAPQAAIMASRWLNGHAGAVEADCFGNPMRWLGFLVWRSGGWQPVDADPRAFNPKDYEGNNGSPGQGGAD